MPTFSAERRAEHATNKGCGARRHFSEVTLMKPQRQKRSDLFSPHCFILFGLTATCPIPGAVDPAAGDGRAAILRLRAISEHGATTDFPRAHRGAHQRRAGWLEWLIFPHHVNYHIEHHLYASCRTTTCASCTARCRAGRPRRRGVVPFAVTLGRFSQLQPHRLH